MRNVVRKTGVEMRVALASPTLTGIKVVQRAGGKSMTDGGTTPKTINGKNAKASKKSLAVVDKAAVPVATGKEWKLGTPGPLPTARHARSVGILPKVATSNTPKVQVDEKTTVFAKRARRARLYFLRDYPGKMSAISAGIRQRDN